MFTLVLDAPTPGAARLRLTGHLDAAAARDVLHAAADVVRSGCSGLVVDLDALTAWDDDAAFALVGCTRLSRWLPDGVEVVARTTAGRRLAATAGICAQPAVPEPVPGTMAACHAS